MKKPLVFILMSLLQVACAQTSGNNSPATATSTLNISPTVAREVGNQPAASAAPTTNTGTNKTSTSTGTE